MIAHKRGIQWLMQGGLGGGGGRRPRWRAKCYDGYWCLHLITNGSMHWQRGQQDMVISGPVVWVGAPGPETAYRPIDRLGWRQHWCAITGPLAAKWWDSGLLPHNPIELPSDKRWAPLFDAILELPLIPDDDWSAARKRNRCEYFLLEVQRVAAAANLPWLERAKAALADGATIVEAAQRCHMAASTFRRRFRSATGRAPQTWQLEERLRRAQHLLATTELPVGAIAEHLGHATQAAFSKQFRQQTGFSPRDWRAAQTAG